MYLMYFIFALLSLNVLGPFYFVKIQLQIKLSRSINHLPREEVLGPLGAEVFIGLSEEEQGKRHIANVEAPTDKDVNSFAKKIRC